MKKLINLILVFNLVSISSTYVVSCKSDVKVNESLDSLYAFKEVFNKSIDDNPGSLVRGYNGIFFDQISNDDDEKIVKNNYFIPDNNKGYNLDAKYFYKIKSVGKKITNDEYNNPVSIPSDTDFDKLNNINNIYKYQVSVDTIAEHLKLYPLKTDDIFYDFSNVNMSIEPSKAHYNINLAYQNDKEQINDNRLVYSVSYDSVNFSSKPNLDYSVKVKLVDFANTFKIGDFSDKNIVDSTLLDKQSPTVELIPDKTDNIQEKINQYKIIFKVKEDDETKVSLDSDVNIVRNSINYFISGFDAFSKPIEDSGDNLKKEVYNLSNSFKIINKDSKEIQVSKIELDYTTGEKK